MWQFWVRLLFEFFCSSITLFSGQTVFIPYIKHLLPQLAYTKELQHQIDEITRISEEEYSQFFQEAYERMFLSKLGLLHELTPSSFQKNEEFWNSLLKLLHR